MQGERLGYLDGWRGLAISFLLIGHFLPLPGINLGAVGVALFFVLSGLFMSRLLFIQEISLGMFYRRRIARIFPGVIVFIIAIIILFAILSRKIDWTELVVAALFINNYFPGEPGQAVMPFGHIWSLSVEEHSYVLLSLLALAIRRNILSTLVATGSVAVLCVVAALFYWMQSLGKTPDDAIWLRTEVSAFGIFISAFLTACFHRRRVPQTSWIVFAVLLVSGIALHWWSVPRPVRLTVGVGVLAIAVNLLEGTSGWLKSMLSARILRQLGIWSFSIYLWQQPLYLLVHREGLSPVLALSLALLFGVASYYCIEKPARHYLNRGRTRCSENTATSQPASETMI